MRALENHLAKYPNSPKKPEIERALVKAAIELKDDRRIIFTASACWIASPAIRRFWTA